MDDFVSDPAVATRLAAAGLSPGDAETMQRIWAADPLDSALAYEAWELRRLGDWNAADAWDMLAHNLNAHSAHTYYSHGLSAHQGASIEASEQARENLWKGGEDAAVDLLDAPVPRQFLVDALQVAKSPQEVDHYVDRYEAANNSEGTETPAEILEEVAMLAALQTRPALDCHCSTR